MCRCLTGMCAGVLLLAAFGCTVDSFLLPQSVVYGPKRIAPGAVEAVSSNLQDGLSEAGIMLGVKRAGADLRIGGVFQNRTVFVLHLSDKKVDGRMQTRVRMQWDRGGDEELWQLVVKILGPASFDSANRPR